MENNISSRKFLLSENQLKYIKWFMDKLDKGYTPELKKYRTGTQLIFTKLK